MAKIYFEATCVSLEARITGVEGVASVQRRLAGAARPSFAAAAGAAVVQDFDTLRDAADSTHHHHLQPQSLPEGEVAADWIRSHGGYVHEALALSNDTQCSARGIITREPITGEAARLPLVVVPEALYMTAAAADRRLSPLLAKHRLPRLAALFEEGLGLALWLAYERSLGDASFYAPYVRTLPAQPPCPWLLANTQLQRSVARLGLDQKTQSHWLAEAKAATAHVREQAGAAAAAVGHILGISAADVAWGMGHVASRAFGQGGDLSMAPFVDLFNHADEASYPARVKRGFWFGGGLQTCIMSQWQGQPLELEAGQEVLISYQLQQHGLSGLEVWLSFGIEPENTSAVEL